MVNSTTKHARQILQGLFRRHFVVGSARALLWYPDCYIMDKLRAVVFLTPEHWPALSPDYTRYRMFPFVVRPFHDRPL